MPGRRSRVAVALLTAWLVAGCGGGSGPALVDSSTTRPVPTTTTAATATTRPGTTAVPTTGAIPTTTGRVPVTTGQTGPAGAPLTFRRLTIRARPGLAGRRRRRPRRGGDQPGLPAQRRPGRLSRVPAARPEPDRHRQRARPLRPGPGLAPGQRGRGLPPGPRRAGRGDADQARQAGRGQGRRQGRRLPRVAGRLRRRPDRRARGQLHPAGLVPEGVQDPGGGRVVDPGPGEALAAARFG